MPELNPDIDRLAATVAEISYPTIADQGIERIDQDAVQLTIAFMSGTCAEPPRRMSAPWSTRSRTSWV